MCFCSHEDITPTTGNAGRSRLSTMTYQLHVSIKQESPSPAGSALPYPDDDTGPTGQGRAGPANKRLKSESEGSAPNPETKNRLKRIVLGRRKARGVTEVLGNLFEKPKPNQLTPADLEKRAKRKKQNREAAKRCREKKKTYQNITAQEHGNILKENAQLQKSICMHIKKLALYKSVLSEHLNCGDCRLAAAIREEHMSQLRETPRQVLSGIPDHFQPDEDLLSAPSTFGLCDFERPGQNYQPASVDSCYDTPISVYSSESTDYSPSSTSGYNDIHNLHSWDLQCIEPDIPADQVSANMLDEMSQLPSLKLDSDDWQQGKPSTERNDFVNTSSASETGSLASYACGEVEDHIPRTSLAYTSCETLPTWNNTDQLYQCVPHNLIQPSSTLIQAVPFTRPTSGQMTKVCSYDHSINSCNQQSNVHPDLNNNSTAGPSIWDKSGDQNQLCGGERYLLKNFPRNHCSPAPSGDPFDHFQPKCHFLSPISPDSYRQ